MKKTKNSVGFYFTIIAAILSAIGIFLYNSVMYRQAKVTYCLIGAVVLGVIALAGSLAMGHKSIFSAVPVVNAALMALAAVLGTELMVNQIGYVIAGLDGMDTINGWIYFSVICVVAMLLNIIASFLPQSAE